MKDILATSKNCALAYSRMNQQYWLLIWLGGPKPKRSGTYVLIDGQHYHIADATIAARFYSKEIAEAEFKRITA